MNVHDVPGLGRGPVWAPLAMAVVVVLTVIGLTGAGAAGLQLSSGGIVLGERSYGSPVQCSLSAEGDTYVRSDQSGSSFGAATTLAVNNSSGSTKRILVSFDLSGCAPAIAADAIVHSATLRLTTATLLTAGSRTYALRRATSSWSEATTWTSQPGVGGVTDSVTVPLDTVGGTAVEWNVVADVQEFVAGEATNHGWRVNDSVEGVTPLLSTELTFSAREAGSPGPQLVITYAP